MFACVCCDIRRNMIPSLDQAATLQCGSGGTGVFTQQQALEWLGEPCPAWPRSRKTDILWQCSRCSCAAASLPAAQLYARQTMHASSEPLQYEQMACSALSLWHAANKMKQKGMGSGRRGRSKVDEVREVRVSPAS